ncbi:MAG: hypothetical protein FWG10_04320 [Eubacteriaceae bacterium]|nr:hypothetical protein [Eubacteriaceae bacterium]
MPRKPAGNVAKHRAEVPQKNGDIYIYEREYQYDPAIKKTKRISNKLVSKIPKGGSEMVGTRPKRKPGSGPQPLAASKQRTGLADILGHAGSASGIDEALLASTDNGTALKIMSIARFLVATGGGSLPHIETWQLTHPIPCAEGITEDICYELCKACSWSAASSLATARSSPSPSTPPLCPHAPKTKLTRDTATTKPATGWRL